MLYIPNKSIYLITKNKDIDVVVSTFIKENRTVQHDIVHLFE